MVEINNKTRSKIDLVLVRNVAENFLKVYKKRNFQVSIVFVGDKTIYKLNKKYRNKNKITDILSFSGDSAGMGEIDLLGEIIIDYAQIKRQAKKYKNSVKEELVFILVHGLFHLLGHDDKTEKEIIKMEKLGRSFIDKFNF